MVFHYHVCSNILEFVKIWVKFFILTFMQLNSKHNFYKIKNKNNNNLINVKVCEITLIKFLGDNFFFHVKFFFKS